MFRLLAGVLLTSTDRPTASCGSQPSRRLTLAPTTMYGLRRRAVFPPGLKDTDRGRAQTHAAFRGRSPQLLLLLASVGAAFAWQPSPAHAGVGLSATGDCPTVVTVGETVTCLVTMQAEFTATETQATGTLGSPIVFIPACASFSGASFGPTVGDPTCQAPPAGTPNPGAADPRDPGVFRIAHTGVGELTCAGITATISDPVDPATGKVHVTPNAPIMLKNGQACRITFSAEVLKMPKDARADLSGVQTNVRAGARIDVPTEAGPLEARGSGSSQTTVLPAPVTPPPPPPPPPPPLRRLRLRRLLLL